MTNAAIVLWSHMLEHIFGILIGGLSIFLGYKLFLALPEQTNSEGKINLPGGVNIWLSRIGPGIFFACFGMILIITAFTNPAKVKVNKAEGVVAVGASINDPQVSSYVQGMSSDRATSANDAELAETRKQIFVLNEAVKSYLKAGIDNQEKTQIANAVDYAKRQMLHQVWQTKWGDFQIFVNWLDKKQPMPIPNNLEEVVEIFNTGME